MPRLGATVDPPIDHQLLWTSMRRLLDRLATAVERETFLDECLDAVVEVLGADRGLVVLTHPGGGSTVVHARAPGRALAPEEREEISRAIIEQAWRSGEPLVWEPGTGRASASIVSLGIVTALAAPLRVAEAAGEAAVRGVLYVDFRSRRHVVEPRHEEFFWAAATLVAMVLEQEERLGVTRERLLQARSAAAPVAGPDGRHATASRRRAFVGRPAAPPIRLRRLSGAAPVRSTSAPVTRTDGARWTTPDAPACPSARGNHRSGACRSDLWPASPTAATWT